jgi:hypothetical protein
MKQYAERYLSNREEFYAVILPRIPLAEIRARIEEAATPFKPTAELRLALESLPDAVTANDSFTAMSLRDLLKKPAYGTSLARTVISIHEALKSAAEIEQTGVLLFEHLGKSMPQPLPALELETVRRRAALTGLLRLDDGLRYHKLKTLSK